MRQPKNWALFFAQLKAMAALETKKRRPKQAPLL